MGKSPFSGIALDNNEEGATYLATTESLTPGEAQESSFSFANC